jgi:hypothetical protein
MLGRFLAIFRFRPPPLDGLTAFAESKIAGRNGNLSSVMAYLVNTGLKLIAGVFIGGLGAGVGGP